MNHHLRWRPQKVWLVEPNSACFYCGEIATSADHVVPMSWARVVFTKQWLVPACGECNSILGNRELWDPEDRLGFVRKKLQKKYRKVLKAPVWDEEDLSELGPTLQAGVRGRQALREAVERRLSHSPPPLLLDWPPSGLACGGDDQWEALWQESAEKFYQFPSTDLVQWAADLPLGARVLEIGAGQGANTQALEAFGADVVAIDVSWTALDLAVQSGRARKATLLCADVLQVSSAWRDAPGYFDAACDVQCLQHLSQDQLPRAYREIAYVLRRGGRFFQMFLTAGQENFPKLSFCDFDSDAIESAGLVITDEGWMSRSWADRTYRYALIEAVKP